MAIEPQRLPADLSAPVPPDTPGEKTSDWPSPASAWGTLAVLQLAYLFSFADRSLLGLLVVPIQADLRISDLQTSLLLGPVFGVLYVLGGLPLGWAADRLSRRIMASCGALLWCAATILCGRALSFPAFFVARMTVGVGEAALSPAAVSMIADLFSPDRRSMAVSVYQMSASIGGGLGMMVAGAIASWTRSGSDSGAWRQVFEIVGGIGLIVPVLLLSRPEPRRRPSFRSHGAESLRLFMRRAGRALALHFGGYALVATASLGSLAWAPTVLERCYGWTPAKIGVWFGLAFLIGGAGGALTGGAYASLRRRLGVIVAEIETVALGTTASIPFAIAAPMAGAPSLAVLLWAATFFFIAFGSGTTLAAIQAITPDHLRARMAALYYIATGLVGLGVGAPAIALAAAYIFGQGTGIGYAIALNAAILLPLAAAALWHAVPAYRQALSEADRYS